MLRGTAGAIVVATVVTAGTLGASAMRDRSATRRADSAVAVAPPSPTPTTVTTTPVDSAPTTTPAASVVQAALPGAAAKGETPRSEAPSFAPVIPAGPSALANGVTAFRADSVITVSFDLPLARTRNPEKFERLVRATLAEVYGPRVDSLLAKLPSGSMSGQGDLLAQLPSSGVRIPLSDARELRVYPETRKGQDGPLVVRYRTLVCGSTDAGCGAR